MINNKHTDSGDVVSGYLRALAAVKKSASRAEARKIKGKLLRTLGQMRISSRPTDKELDALWSLCIRERDKKVSPLCRICGRRKGTVGYHIVSKQAGHHIRWRLDNGVLACSGCNLGEVLNRTSYRTRHMKLFGKALVEKLEYLASAGEGHPIERWGVKLMLEHELRRIRADA